MSDRLFLAALIVAAPHMSNETALMLSATCLVCGVVGALWRDL